MAKKSNTFTRNWGLCLLAVAILMWTMRDVGPGMIAAASFASAAWALAAAPTWCGAPTRQGLPCRENTWGLLGGCYRRQHKWARWKAICGAGRFRAAFDGWFTGAQQQVATCSLMVAVGSLLVAMGAWLVK